MSDTSRRLPTPASATPDRAGRGRNDAHDGGTDPGAGAEATAFLATLERTPPGAPTACAGWTAHEVVAHLAAGAAEMAARTQSALAGRPAAPTAGFAEREAPFVAMDDTDLRTRLVTEALRLNRAVDDLRRRGGTVLFSGRTLSAAELEMHGRSEAALHRWDIAGDDELGQHLLDRPELTAHAVTTLNAMVEHSTEDVATRARRAGLRSCRATFASPGQPDVVLVVDGGGARLVLDDASPRPVASADAATRLLALWGRRSPARPVAWGDDDGQVIRLATFLWGTPAAAGRRPAPSGASSETR